MFVVAEVSQSHGLGDKRFALVVVEGVVEVLANGEELAVWVVVAGAVSRGILDGKATFVVVAQRAGGYAVLVLLDGAHAAIRVEPDEFAIDRLGAEVARVGVFFQGKWCGLCAVVVCPVVLGDEAAIGGFAVDFADVAVADGASGRLAVAVGVVVGVVQRGVVDGVCCRLFGVEYVFRQGWCG